MFSLSLKDLFYQVLPEAERQHKKCARKPCGKVYTVYKRLLGCQGKSVAYFKPKTMGKLNQKITYL
jgi:hypothetical protein